MTAKRKAEVLARQAWCFLCHARFGRLSDVEIDHRIPLELLGDEGVENLQALCADCHKAKTASDKRSIAKAKRVAGETGQRARRKRRGGGSIKSRST